MSTVTDAPSRERTSPSGATRRLLPPVRRTWWGDGVAFVVAAHLGVVTALWASADGLSALTQGSASALTSVGRLAGLWASALLLLQVLGMARVPVAERTFGQDRLTAWHRWAGFTSFWLLIVHLVAITFGYAAAEGRTVVVELWNITVNMPGMLLAFVGTVLLVLVVATSIRAARRRVRYESWHLLHLYAYLGVGLALPHQLWTGTSFLTHPWAATYWWTLYGATLAAVLVYRVAVPLAISARHQLRVQSVEPDGRGLVTITVTGRDLGRLRVEAGQFFTWRFLTGPGWTRGHPLSLSGAPTTAGLRITMNVSGDDGARIAGMAPGTRVLVEGPYGKTTTSARSARHIAGFAAGAGIAPIIGLLQDNASTGGDTLVYRHSADGDAALTQDTRHLVESAGLRYVPLTGRRSTTGTSWLPAEHGHLPGAEAVRLLVPGDLADHDVFVCGPPAWASAVVADVRAAGVPAARIHLESYDW